MAFNWAPRLDTPGGVEPFEIKGSNEHRDCGT